MKDLTDIFTRLEQIRTQGGNAVIATVVKARGSTYRREGARMLVTGEGQIVGSISGGCLEEDVREHAQKILQQGDPFVVTYDLNADDDLVWGLGLGCNGVMDVLFERIPAPAEVNFLDFMRECICGEEKGVLATVFATQGDTWIEIGSHFTFSTEDLSQGESVNEFTGIMRADASHVLESGRSQVKSYEVAGGNVEVLLEVLQPIPLVIFGAGHDALPVVNFAKGVGWQVTVVDSRPAYASKERFPLVDEVILSPAEEIQKQVPLHSCTVAVVMTHNYLQDRELLAALIPSAVRYLGVLGPKRRTEKLLQELKERGISPTPQQMERIYSPIGVDIGAETSEEIAVAVIAEIQTVLSGRSGKLLRERRGPIHDPCRQ